MNKLINERVWNTVHITIYLLTQPQNISLFTGDEIYLICFGKVRDLASGPC